MATRPVFLPQSIGNRLATEVPIDFKWHAGMAASQKKKNVEALHQAAKLRGLKYILEISSKSEEEVGRRLSAFSLKINIDEENDTYLECAYQGSKVFQNGGPYLDIFSLTPKAAKQDQRLKESGQLIAFEFKGEQYPLSPKNAFYDWLYLKALFPHRDWIRKNVKYDGYTDIEFNPAKSVNCQARAFAELKVLDEEGTLEKAVNEFSYFANLLVEM
jgi:hypothetical protein